jgi:hypothetical protein
MYTHYILYIINMSNITSSSSLLFPNINRNNNKNNNISTNDSDKIQLASSINEYGYLPIHTLVATTGISIYLSIYLYLLSISKLIFIYHRC